MVSAWLVSVVESELMLVVFIFASCHRNEQSEHQDCYKTTTHAAGVRGCLRNSTSSCLTTWLHNQDYCKWKKKKKNNNVSSPPLAGIKLVFAGERERYKLQKLNNVLKVSLNIWLSQKQENFRKLTFLTLSHKSEPSVFSLDCRAAISFVRALCSVSKDFLPLFKVEMSRDCLYLFTASSKWRYSPSLLFTRVSTCSVMQATFILASAAGS